MLCSCMHTCVSMHLLCTCVWVVVTKKKWSKDTCEVELSY
jgi:hypothetical protein